MLKKLKEILILFNIFRRFWFRRYSKKYDDIILSIIENKGNIVNIEYYRGLDQFEIDFNRKFTRNAIIIGTSNKMYIRDNFTNIRFKHGCAIIIDYKRKRPSLEVTYQFVKFINDNTNYGVTWSGRFKEKEINRDFQLSEFIN